MASNAYVANAGDTLFSIARRFGVTAEALRAENRLSRNAAIHAGEKIKLPETYTDHGPLTARTRVETPPPVRPQPSYRPPLAAPPSSMTEPATSAPDTTEPPAQPFAPQPSTPQPSTPQPSMSAPATAPAAPQPYTPTPPRSYTPRPYTPPATPARPYAPPTGAPSAPSVSDSQISELGRGRFVWPLQGPIVSDYGPKTAGQRNDGINIGATVGASVRSAAAGDVVYAGDQVPGFGNLVLIKHPDGWVTAYGHLSRVEVKMQQHVAQGEEIGRAGATGGVSTPQVHFEIRYAPTAMERAKPVDPKLVLPQE
jgi:murein DD-endopeptidase MepM/ murein hydrolase activator NlpD